MIGIGINLWEGQATRTITFGSVPTLYVGVSGTISGTATNSNSFTLTLTVDGESFGTATVTAGAWSITATPSAAMAGTGVAVVATLTGATASTTANVLVRTITFGVLPNIYVATGTGITYAIAGTTANVPDGTSIPITVNGQAWGTGTVTSNAFSVSATPSDAMASLTAAVVATVPGATKTGSIRCVGPPLFAGKMLDLRRKLDYSLAPAVQTWGDLSGGNYDVSAPAAGNQPADGATGPDFDGASSPNGDHLINTALGTALGTDGSLYAAAVFRADGTSTFRYIYSCASSNTNGLIAYVETNAVFLRIGNPATQFTYAFSDTASFHLLEVELVGGNAKMYLDGVQRDTTKASTSANYAGMNLRIGSGHTPGYFDGVIANVLISTDPSAGNVALMREWLLAVKP